MQPDTFSYPWKDLPIRDADMNMSSLEDMIERVRRQRSMSGYPMQPPCPESEIRSLPQRIKAELGCTVPERYLDLLRITNGFSENALRVFASRTTRNLESDIHGKEFRIWGIIEANQQLFRDNRETFEQLLIFAAREAYLYAQVIETGAFIRLLDAEEEVTDEYETFDAMMIAAVETILIE